MRACVTGRTHTGALYQLIYSVCIIRVGTAPARLLMLPTFGTVFSFKLNSPGQRVGFFFFAAFMSNCRRLMISSVLQWGSVGNGSFAFRQHV